MFTPSRIALRAVLFSCAMLGIVRLPLSAQTATFPSFTEVSVHDPSIVRAGAEFFVFGSHMASARTTDLMHWTQYSSTPTTGNPLAPNLLTEFAEGLAWAETTTFWAPDVIQLADGKFYMYYCMCKGDSPRSALGLARADTISGPYTNLGIMLKSGMWNQVSPDGTIYDATKHPNAVDPDVFFDKDGKLWMIYGSYSGGIFIIELEPTTGWIKPGQGYGTKLIGGNHTRLEGAYVLYSPESDYYYMFLSFGGLDTTGGYNIRLGRSRNPNGPYYDAAGNDLTNVKGNFSNDALVAPYGVKLMGNYQFLSVAGEPSMVGRGYLSPGHNSAYYDPNTGKHFLIFHTRFVGRGEEHEVRVHQLVMNADDWLVAMPQRYAGESLAVYHPSQVTGSYKYINHGKATSPALTTSTLITLNADNSITGAATGTWSLSGDYDVTLVIDGVTYKGVFLKQWDDDNSAWVPTFSALSSDGVAAWGKRTAIATTVVERLDLDFSAPATSGVRDATGQFTGFTTRLPGTGTALAINDPNLTLNTTTGRLMLKTTRADFNGRAGLSTNSSPGIALANLGFTGTEDFSATVVFRPLPTALGNIDQVGLYVGNHSDSVTRAGTIVWAAPERYSSHSQNGVDGGGHFYGFGFDGTDGMTVTLTRIGGVWRYFVDGVEWNPTASTSFLNNRSDLIIGVFAITPNNSVVKTVEIDSFSVAVVSATPLLSALEQWRVTHFSQTTSSGLAADDADADGDGLSNFLEYAVGADPLVADFSSAPRSGKSTAPARLTLTFNRIADPTLIYTVEANSTPGVGFTSIWTSTGAANTAGTVTVSDTVDISADARRFLRLRVGN